ncbi:MAG: TetR/AcrR family transcriptional regulator [Methylophilus sp.]|uniref:TetR/AcrR family transcriptional regulator n=1 Tax=Methylophilus sp. TaxID=29541 RepID=UPI003F9EEE71
MMNESLTPRKRGRPVAFDYDTALEKAMYAFWQHGYEGTSMATLMTAMDMNKASIYAAYGSKEALFQKAVEAYVQGPAGFIAESLQATTAAKVIHALLTQAAHMLTDESHAAGCLVTKGALAGSAEAASMQALLSGYRNTIELKLGQRFERAKSDGDLAPQTDTAALAKLVMTLHQGMTVQAVSGVEQAELLAMVTMATQLINAYVVTMQKVET